MARAKKGHVSAVIYSEVELPEDFKEKAKEISRADSLKRVSDFKSIPEQVAKSTVCVKNFYIPDQVFRDRFRYNDRMNRIDKMFPYADIYDKKKPPVMLLVDEPKTSVDVDICLIKASHLKKLGYHYIYLESDSTIADALEQLGVL